MYTTQVGITTAVHFLEFFCAKAFPCAAAAAKPERMNSHFAIRLAAFFGFLGVALGAFGAHGLHDLLIKNAREATWETAVLYHLIHAAVLLLLALQTPVRRAALWCFTSGILIFSGTLYILAITNMRWLGAITPLGGLLLLAGWLILLIRGAK